MLRTGHRAVGVDPEAPEGPEYAQIEFERYEPPGPLDVVVASTSLHHVGDLAEVLDRVRTTLRPEGRLVVVEWASERFDQETAQWCFDRLPAPAPDDQPGWLQRHRDEWAVSGLPWGPYFQGWRRDEGLHDGADVLRELDARFERRLCTYGPYFFAELEATTAADEQAAIDAEDSAGPEPSGEPDVFTQFFAFPYQVGPRLVQALLDAGGQARLDEAFRRPPVSTEQAIHPDRFLRGDAIKDVALPAADGAVIDEGTLGEMGLVMLVDSATSRSVALKAGEGWGGDHYVAWASGAKTCVRFNVVMDTAQDTTELLSGLRNWAANNPGATVRGTGPVAVTNCA